jgi:5,10-methylenetetrahydromethanopterin reductase
VGLGFSGVPYSARELVRYAQAAEASRVDSFWMAEDYFLRDAVSVLGTVAGATRRLLLGTGVVNPFTRHPVLLAQTAATLDEISKERVLLAVGTGVLPLLEQCGLPVHKPRTGMRETFELLRRLLRGETVTHQGAVFHVSGVRLGHNPYFGLLGNFRPPRRTIPLYLAAVGPRMLRLAGELADGVLLTAGAPLGYVRKAIEHVRGGATATGRAAADIDIAAYLVTWLREWELPPGLRGFVAFTVAYAAPEFLEHAGVPIARGREIRRELEAHGLGRAAALVDRTTARAFVAMGTLAACAERVEQLWAAGVTHVILFPPGGPVGPVLQLARRLG